MAERVIHHLEAVDIDHEQRQRRCIPLRTGGFSSQDLMKSSASSWPPAPWVRRLTSDTNSFTSRPGSFEKVDSSRIWLSSPDKTMNGVSPSTSVDLVTTGSSNSSI